MYEFDIWSRIRLYRFYSDGSLKFIGERVLEDDKYMGRILKSMMEDKNIKNVGSFIVMRGWYASIYEDGIDLENNGITDRKSRLPKVIYLPFFQRLVSEYLEFRGEHIIDLLSFWIRNGVIVVSKELEEKIEKWMEEHK